MAFVFRSKRGTLSHQNTPSQIGPGSYNPHKTQKRTKVSYAPFSSSSERTHNPEPYDFTPGPGEYIKSKWSQTVPVSSSAFVSRVGRFQKQAHEKKEVTPGPGAYKTKDLWVKPKQRTRKQRRGKSAVEWVRVSAAPSIPTYAQSYGYEENDQGDLTLQKPPTQGYTGVGADSVGPGAYDQSRAENLRKKPGIDFAKGSHRKILLDFTKSKQPGPGSYDPFKQEKKKKAGLQESSVFQSQVRRWKPNKNATPGPGTYNWAEAMDEPKQYIPPQYQFFGSKVTRDDNSMLAAKHTDTPGPGSYKVSSDFKQHDLYSEPNLSDTNPAFMSTAARFQGSQRNRNPGPGSYIDVSNLSYELSKKIFGRNTSFGSTQKRFRQKKAKDKTPGPGAYVERKLVRAVKPHSMFASVAPRFKTTKAKEGPDPTTYAVNKHGIASKLKPERTGEVRESSMFRSDQPRFSDVSQVKQAIFDASRGPGSYNPRKETVMGKRAPAVSSGFRSGAPRFKGYGPQEKTPGPGAYGGQNPHHSLLKRSFNITVGGDFY